MLRESGGWKNQNTRRHSIVESAFGLAPYYILVAAHLHARSVSAGNLSLADASNSAVLSLQPQLEGDWIAIAGRLAAPGILIAATVLMGWAGGPAPGGSS